MLSGRRPDGIAPSCSCCLPEGLCSTPSARPITRSERQTGVLLDRLHNEERSRLPDAGESDQLLPVEPVEVLHVSDSNFQQIVEITGDQVAIENILHPKHSAFEGCEALRCGPVEHDADHDKSSEADLGRRDVHPNARDEALIEKALRPPVARGRADVDALRQFGIGQPSISLQRAQNFHIDTIDSSGGRFFHLSDPMRMK